MSTANSVAEAAEHARRASRDLALATRAQKDRALHAMADALGTSQQEILAANAEDVSRAEAGGTPGNVVDRLRLTPERLAAMAEGLRDVAGLPDPVGEVLRGSTLANGLELRQVRVPFGVVGMIYEARPNVTADAAGICLKSGNAVLLRGSSSARSSNAAIVAALRTAVECAGLDPDVVQLVPGDSRESVKELMRARGLVDVLIPRGGAGLIRSVVEESTVPVIETGVGNCHVYVDRGADLDKAIAIVLNAKTHRTSVCNAAESLLVHADVANELLPRLVAVDGHPGPLQRRDQAGQQLVGDISVHQQGLRGVAHAGPVGLGVEDDRQRLVEIGGPVDVDVAVAHAGLDHRHRRLLHDAADQSRSAARDQHVDEPAGPHQRLGPLVALPRDQLDDVVRQAGPGGRARCPARWPRGCRPWPTPCATSPGCPTPSGRWSAARPWPTACRSGRSGCPWGWSA